MSDTVSIPIKENAQSFQEPERSGFHIDAILTPRTFMLTFTIILSVILATRVLMELHVISFGATLNDEYKYADLQRLSNEKNIENDIGAIWADYEEDSYFEDPELDEIKLEYPVIG
mmetsp:Transcript_20386/g.34159  ORF Transcript_20386/g.34159 Transcript_20386/m.34159 type:complete len:116 (+) Transcript_20386:571-918(+)|eukprot:CAMPEP_0198211272 /NCGR_PEP_ID=MMETSP1445-20131203/22933_1 /TAXON_ID=36898 /ORGANISM="Pyramimonas sp., Strain CCMP2087" /LENGTH=115 /DNA_ID=CAMNT_0043885493 /DNA_START=571 /DNA_END=918 /DNA_ORIENTATION=+